MMMPNLYIPIANTGFYPSLLNGQLINGSIIRAIRGKFDGSVMNAAISKFQTVAGQGGVLRGGIMKQTVRIVSPNVAQFA
jgi:hypothetical protein